MSQEVGLRIAKNSIYSIGRTLLTLPLTLLLTPYIIVRLGKEEFGIWALVGVISSYAQLSDFGITESLIKFIAEYKARNDARQLNQLINTALSAYIVLSSVCCILFFFALPFIIDKVLNIPLFLQSKAHYVFTIAIALFFINLAMSVFASLLIGFQQMGHSNLISLISTIIMAVGTFLFLYNGYGLEGLIINNAIVTVFVIISNIVVAKRLFPAMRINPFSYSCKNALNDIFGFSWKVQLSTMSNLLVYQLDRVLLSHYLGLAAVSNYEIANRVAYQAKSFLTSILKPMVPAASDLQARNETGKIAGLYNRSFKYMAAITVPVSLLIIALAHPFFRTWMGQGYDVSAFTLQFLMLAYMINIFPGPAYFILNGVNKPQVAMYSSVFSGILNLLLCIFLVRQIGYFGIVTGIFISILVSSLYFIVMVHKNIPGLSWAMYRKSLVRPTLASSLFGALFVILDGFVNIRGFAVLTLLGAMYMIVIGYAMIAGKFFDEFDRSTLAKLMPLRAFAKLARQRG